MHYARDIKDYKTSVNRLFRPGVMPGLKIFLMGALLLVSDLLDNCLFA
jgi:hypothetical protein